MTSSQGEAKAGGVAHRVASTRSRRGDLAHRERFERLFHDEYGAVLRYAAMRADLDLAKDAAAQTFLVAWRRREELPDPPRAWLLGVTRRTLADLRRSGRRQEELRSRLSAVEVAGEPPVGVEVQSDREVVRAALSRIPGDDAEILRLVYWDDLSCRQAAAVLGCSVTALKVRLLRARRRFERAVEPLDRVEQGVRAQRARAPGSTDPRTPSSEEAS